MCVDRTSKIGVRKMIFGRRMELYLVVVVHFFSSFQWNLVLVISKKQTAHVWYNATTAYMTTTTTAAVAVATKLITIESERVRENGTERAPENCVANILNIDKIRYLESGCLSVKTLCFYFFASAEIMEKIWVLIIQVLSNSMCFDERWELSIRTISTDIRLNSILALVIAIFVSRFHSFFHPYCKFVRGSLGSNLTEKTEKIETTDDSQPVNEIFRMSSKSTHFLWSSRSHSELHSNTHHDDNVIQVFDSSITIVRIDARNW